MYHVYVPFLIIYKGTSRNLIFFMSIILLTVLQTQFEKKTGRAMGIVNSLIVKK